MDFFTRSLQYPGYTALSTNTEHSNIGVSEDTDIDAAPSHPTFVSLMDKYLRTNDPVDPDDQPLLSFHVDAVARSLDQQYKEISALKARLASRVEAFNTTKSELHRARVTMSLVRELSPELISEILKHCVSSSLRLLERADEHAGMISSIDVEDEEKYRESLPRPTQIIQLAHVCRRWRSIALSTPQLWQALYITSADVRTARWVWIPEWIGLAKNVSQELYLDLSMLDWKHYSRIGKALGASAHRLAGLRLNIPNLDFLERSNPDRWLDPISTSWDRLRYLRVHLIAKEVQNRAFLPVWNDAPELEVAELYTYGASLSHNLLPWNQLRRLSVRSVTQSDDLLQILRHCGAKLDELDLQMLSGEDFVDPPVKSSNFIILESLKSLRIRGWSGASNVLQALTTPNIMLLETGGIRLEEEFECYLPRHMQDNDSIESYQIEEVIFFIQRHLSTFSKNLVDLRFVCQEFSEEGIYICLEMLPNLKQLTLDCEYPGSHMDDQFILGLLGTHEYVFVPKLEMLNFVVLRSCVWFEIDSVVKVIESRGHSAASELQGKFDELETDEDESEDESEDKSVDQRSEVTVLKNVRVRYHPNQINISSTSVVDKVESMERSGVLILE